MTAETKPTSLMRDRLFRTGLWSTVLAFVACLATHVVTLFGIVGAVAWLSTVEHALIVAVVGFAALTVYAAFRHRRCARGAGCAHEPGSESA